MSRATFHPFPNLPVEIRLQIWEDTCFDWGSGRFGLHYIKLNENRQLAPLNCEWQTAGPRNRSAYLWYAGLWTACKESRDVAAKHWSNQVWPDMRENTKDKGLGDVIWFQSGPFPRPIYSLKDLYTGKVITNPGTKSPIWTEIYFSSLLSHGNHWSGTGNPFMPRLRMNGGVISLTTSPTSLLSLTHPGIRRLKKFSPGNRVKEYPPSLAFLIRLLLDQAHNKKYRKTVQLIDRNALWHVESEQLARHHLIYMDCDHEYFEVYSSELERSSPLSDFLSLLDRLIQNRVRRAEIQV